MVLYKFNAMASSENRPISEDEAKLHLFKKLKYDMAIQEWKQLIQITTQSKDRVTFYVGKGQCSYPAVLVRTFTNIRSSGVRVSDKYSLQEIKSLFEIILKLEEYSCQGLTQNYKDWKPITSLVNMIELSKKFVIV